ncbi:MAG: Uncharacterized protein G01um101433_224 [Parcubacteria group bacterium Gr01-1014_33]|nr:MAG: Uncharacterized protein G01um101433_224 [Parcubacteria group bacterium Gr01-1014_33]
MDTSPIKPIKSTPKDVFLHLLSIVTFYISVISFMTLWVQYINILLPDRVNFSYLNALDSILWSTAVLVIAFPFYLFTVWFLERDLREFPEKRELKVRKWLLYFTLFISAITILVVLIMLVYNFLKGALTLPFSLKILVVLLIAAAVFGYYFWDLRRTAGNSRITISLASAVSLVILASVVAGFFLVGTPATQRSRRFDEERINHMSSLQGYVVNYWQQKGRLPATTKELEDSLSGFAVPKDPETDQEYEYRVKDPLSFELCATFGLSSDEYSGRSIESRLAKPIPYSAGFPASQENWNHEAGRACFIRTIDPELYKPRPIGGTPEKPL